MTFINKQYQLKYLERQIQRFGAETLNDQELMYVVLQTFCSDKLAQEISEIYFAENYNLSQMNKLTRSDWQLYFKSEAKSLKMEAICELIKRTNQSPQLILGKICSSKMVGEYLQMKMSSYHQEVLYGVFLDTQNQIIYEKDIFKGTLNQATVHPREIFKIAIQYNAARVIIAHNHPSGHTEPSQNDHNMTKRLVKSGEILGIELLDHLVIGQDDYFSFREQQFI